MFRSALFARTARAFATLAASAALATGCSKSVAPPGETTAARERAVESAMPGARDIRGELRAFRARLTFVGTVVERAPGGRVRPGRQDTWFTYSTGDVGERLDTIPANARLVRVQWGNPRTGVVTEGSLPSVQPGANSFTLPSPTPEGGTATFRFYAGYRPSVWWAGPDPRAWPASPDGDGRAVTVTDWEPFATSPPWPSGGRGAFGPDSFAFVPAQRLPIPGQPERRTFYEIFGDRIWARSEGDSVHQGAIIVLVNGGFDRDSEYRPRVVAGDPALPSGWEGDLVRYSVLNAQGLIGSPIGFRYRFEVRPPGGGVLQSAMTTPYPVFDANSPFRSPNLFGYLHLTLPGKWYVQARAEDAQGQLSLAGSSLGDLVELVDSGGGSPADHAVRRSIVKFYARPPIR
ncbi:MAG: hypothetical protein HZA61_01620 [Candidatus Eisenbacteria bacterium]|uniref:Uncharacterized protein n=1 Tax=Eiseniibacteriota bacterium TaxID=2212470 RepID=A0A933SAL8_UNCEI|nr:hypothetical protein [Candidatus Eisenbacteria bacterium]